ncbi:MAG TPA: HlyD family efflux transporter periplasmic adaptor subunit [Rhodopila sp.]
MAASLFRLEAIEFQRTRAWAGATTAQPLATWLLTGFFAAAIAAAAMFLTLGTYGRKETVTGYLAPLGGIAKVLPSAAGVVTELYVSDGETVKAGQRLLLVRSARRGAQGQSVDAAVIDRLQAKRDAVAERIEIEQRSTDEQRRSLTDSLAGLEAEVATMAESMRTQRERLKVAHEQVESVRPTVVQGFTSMTEFRRRQDMELSLQQATTDLYRQISTKAVDVREKRHALAQLEAKTADNLALLRSSLAEADAAIAEARGKEGYVVSAPVAGRITSLQAYAGMSTDAAVPFMSIVPDNARLAVSLLVPARAIGFVARGQPVRVGFDPFPFQRFGLYNATIDQVSTTLLKPTEASGAMALKEPSYRVTARLERQTITAYGREIALRPDMSLKADIIFDRRSLIEWLFDPLMSARGRI